MVDGICKSWNQWQLPCHLGSMQWWYLPDTDNLFCWQHNGSLHFWNVCRSGTKTTLKCARNCNSLQGKNKGVITNYHSPTCTHAVTKERKSLLERLALYRLGGSSTTTLEASAPYRKALHIITKVCSHPPPPCRSDLSIRHCCNKRTSRKHHQKLTNMVQQALMWYTTWKKHSKVNWYKAPQNSMIKTTPTGTSCCKINFLRWKKLHLRSEDIFIGRLCPLLSRGHSKQE